MLIQGKHLPKVGKEVFISLEKSKRITILSGHFGSGKTEIAINLALKEKKIHKRTAIYDLDIINPYFRSRDVSNVFQEQNIELIAPMNRFATADLPIVSGEIYRVLHDHSYRVIIDAGGDKDGARALGQYYHEWMELNPELLFVLNAKRPYVSTVEGARFTIEQIEKTSRLRVTGIINNTNIGHETSMEDILNGYELSSRLSDILSIPLLYTTISVDLEQDTPGFAKSHQIMYIKRFLKLPWEG